MAVFVSSEKIRYLVNERGEPTDVLVDYETWRSVMDALELLEDLSTAQAYLERRKNADSPADLGLTRLLHGLDILGAGVG